MGPDRKRTPRSEKFQIFLCGLDYVVETDHKPLVPLLSKKDLIWAPIRCQRLLMRLARYSVKGVYVPGKYLVVADALSRLQENTEGNDTSAIEELNRDVEAYVNAALSYIPASKSTVERIRDAQQNEKQIHDAITYTLQGWQYCEGENFEYFKSRGELSVTNGGILLFQDRLLIPSSMREEFMLKIHGAAHLSLTKCRDRIKMSVWWPGISADMDKMIKRCNFCQIHQRKQKAEPLKPSPLPDRPWQKIALDLFHFRGKTYLITVDYFSRWIEISFLESTTTNSVIKKLKGIFSRFGIVEKIRTDGGPQFISQEFRQFCRQNEISHSVSDPYLAQGNGAAERSVQTAKRILKTKDPTTALMEYRSTPIQVTGYAVMHPVNY